MPTTPRKSSLGGMSRRGPLRAHIPYRGDNPEVGKRTGITVQHVERQSDGFESFEQVIQQADGRTPPRPKERKKSLTSAAYQDDDYGDDGGEESMQLDSPVQNLANVRPPVSPTRSLRNQSSSRPVARTSDIDFDKILSPRPNTSLQGKGVTSSSKFMRISEPEPDISSPGPDNEVGPGPFSDYASPISPRRKSFGSMEEEEDEGKEGEDEEGEEPQEMAPKSKQDKGKRKAEPDQERGKKKENQTPREGIRRSKREHYRPLEYWRGEKLVYGRIHYSGPILVPQIKEIIRIPKDVPVPLGTKRKRGATRARSQSKARQSVEDVTPPPSAIVNPEEGWDDKTEAKCTVIHFTTKEEVERRIAWTAKMVEPRQAANHSWSFDKIFGDDEFIAAGQLIIPPGGRKPSKAAKDNTYVFYVIEGAVNFKIHNTSMILATGGMFMVPRGNTYFIENICERDAKLFFTQARKVEMGIEDLAARAEVAAEVQRRKSAVRSSSAGAPLTKPKVPTPNERAKSMAAYPIGT